MSVLIQGMDMPKSCRDCRFCNGEADTEYGVCAWCDVDGETRDAYARQGCPLIPVPPHGRLIDADAIMTKLKETSKHVFGDDSIPECSALSIVADYIETAPTVIPAESEGE